MEAWQSGLMQHPAKMLYSKGYRRFESSRLRQFSEFGFWAISALPRQRRGEATTLKKAEIVNWRSVLIKIRTYFQENPDADF